ncbi:GNAT family N-acetyltransferase [Amycolatopsis sp. NPDC059021]|uniref:GNAT family N-acetyltransferase n=1 Tax=Amycolatopsis sp. NPDC059021 TaxID=3346704 RepID=UPI00366DD3BE
MKIEPLSQDLIPQVLELMDLGAPYITARTYSDYWLYARLFASTCPIALDGDTLTGAIMAFRSQEDPADVYVQDVMIHPEHRRRGITTALLDVVRTRAAEWGCARLYLTSEPDNIAAHATWTKLGFTNIPGDRDINGVSVITDFKGPGKTRAVYELSIG